MWIDRSLVVFGLRNYMTYVFVLVFTSQLFWLFGDSHSTIRYAILISFLFPGLICVLFGIDAWSALYQLWFFCYVPIWVVYRVLRVSKSVR